MKQLNTDIINNIILFTNKILKIIFILFICLLIYIFLLINKELKITTVILKILKLISPLFIGSFLSYLLNPLINRIRLKRIYSVSIIYLLFIIIFALLMYLIVPNLKNQIIDISEYLPEFVDNINVIINNLMAKFSITKNYKINIQNLLNNPLTTFFDNFPNNCLSIINDTFSIIACIGSSLVISFYISLDYNIIKDNIFILIPKKKRRRLKRLFSTLSEYIFTYIKGTFLVILIIFILSFIIFLIFGLKAPIFFALLNAFTNIIPYIGPIIGAIPVILISFMQSNKLGIIITISLIMIQVIDNTIIHPLLMGKTMKLHPVTIIISLLLFDYFFGIIGMCIAVPMTAIIKTIILYLDKRYKIFNFDKIKIVEGRK